jgi:hypothetical protein
MIRRPWREEDGSRFFDRNRNSHSLEYLMQFENQYVAWSWDGDFVVAAAATQEELYAKLDGMGVNTQRVIFDFVEIPC